MGRLRYPKIRLLSFSEETLVLPMKAKRLAIKVASIGLAALVDLVRSILGATWGKVVSNS